jgi:hypothetical protein
MIVNILDYVHCEYFYLQEIFEHVIPHFDDSYNVIAGVIHDNNKKEILELVDSNKKNILVMVSEESEAPFNCVEFEKFDLVFRTYNNNMKFDLQKIFPIPCGYITRLNFPHHKAFLGPVNPKPLKERETEMFFSGQPASDRIQCVKAAQKIPSTNSIIQLTKGFVYGFELNDYFKRLCNSKIALVPRGACIVENFRFFDAYHANCVVITTMPLNTTHKKLWYYKDCPAILLRGWSELTPELVKSVLENIEDYEEQNKRYYEKAIAPTGVAKYITEVIKNKFL